MPKIKEELNIKQKCQNNIRNQLYVEKVEIKNLKRGKNDETWKEKVTATKNENFVWSTKFSIPLPICLLQGVHSNT